MLVNPAPDEHARPERINPVSGTPAHPGGQQDEVGGRLARYMSEAAFRESAEAAATERCPGPGVEAKTCVVCSKRQGILEIMGTGTGHEIWREAPAGGAETAHRGHAEREQVERRKSEIRGMRAVEPEIPGFDPRRGGCSWQRDMENRAPVGVWFCPEAPSMRGDDGMTDR